MAKKPIYLTPKGLEKYREELRYLKEEKRRELADYMGSALADGDLSENSAYDEARQLQSANEARIADLEEVVHTAIVIEADDENDPTVQLGKTVVLRNDAGDEQMFSLVGTLETSILDGRISDESPVGQRLVGRTVGDKVKLQTDNGEEVFTIAKVGFIE